MKLAPFLSNPELDRILAAIHKRVMSDDDEKKEEYQKFNVNPLRNNM